MLVVLRKASSADSAAGAWARARLMRRAAARRREASSGVRDCRQELRGTVVCLYYPSQMAVNHVVWIKFAAEVPPNRVREHLEALRRLKDEIPDISSLSVGENFTDRAQGCTHGLMTMRDA